jgi:hypothetical protein
VLAERIAFVEKNRKPLVRDAERETERARARYLELVDELAQVREDLVELRQTTVWASLYPNESLATLPRTMRSSAGGGRRPSRGFPASAKSRLTRLSTCSATTPRTSRRWQRAIRRRPCRA